MIKEEVTHYKDFEKLGKVPNFSPSAFQRVAEILRLSAKNGSLRQVGIPTLFIGICERRKQ